MDSLAGTKILAGLFAVLIVTAGCGESAKLPLSATVGSDPVIPPPEKTMIPTLHIATAKGWPDGGRPAPAVGTEVAAFATGLEHPRWLYTLPNGDVLVAETNAPPAARGRQGRQGLDHEADDEAGGRRRAERQPHHACCATRTATAWPSTARCSSRGSTRPSAWRWSATSSTSPTPTPCVRFPYTSGRDADRRRRASRWSTCPRAPINHHWTKNLHRQPRRQAALRDRRARTATSPRTGMEHEGGARRSGRSTATSGTPARVRLGAAQPERPGLGAAHRRAVDGGQRARRARQRPRPRLPHLGADGALLRLAVQLLRDSTSTRA